MTALLEIEFLGTGTSVGVPMIGCVCDVCLSDDPKNKRLRSSILVRCGEKTYLVDSTPDLRQQALRYGITRLDAVFYSHCHLDHVAGFDDLRAFCWGKEEGLPIYAGPRTMSALESMYAWAFTEKNKKSKGYIRPIPHVLESAFWLDELKVTPLPVNHGTVETLGYLFEVGGFAVAYIPDVKEVPESTKVLMLGIDILIVDALRPSGCKAHSTHFLVGDSIQLADEVRAGCCYFTHMSHDIDFAIESEDVPDNVFLAYDGLVLRVEPSDDE